MHLMRFKTIAEYIPGKMLFVAEVLFRSPQDYNTEEMETHTDVECYVAAVMQGIPATQRKMDCIRIATTTDSELQAVITLIKTGWPQQKSQIPTVAREYMLAKTELSEHDIRLLGSALVQFKGCGFKSL